MAQQHARPRIAHDLARKFPRLGLIAVDRTLGARGLVRPVGTFLQPAFCVAQKPGAICAQLLASRTLMVAHQPIPEWQWPAMEMEFTVAEGVDISKLAEGQSPKVMVIACSDSRVDPAQLFVVYPGGDNNPDTGIGANNTASDIERATAFRMVMPAHGFTGNAGYAKSEALAAIGAKADVVVSCDNGGLVWTVSAGDGGNQWEQKEPLTFYWQSTLPPSGAASARRAFSCSSAWTWKARRTIRPSSSISIGF